MEPMQPSTKPFFHVYVEAPIKKDARDYSNYLGDANRSHVMDAITQGLSRRNMEGIALKVKELLELGSSVNWKRKCNFNFPQLGPYVTPLCLAAEYTNDLELIKVLISKGAIMHKIPSAKAQKRIDKAAKELLFEQSKVALEARVDGDAFLGLFPYEIKNKILELRLEVGPYIQTKAPHTFALDKERLDKCERILKNIDNDKSLTTL